MLSNALLHKCVFSSSGFVMLVSNTHFKMSLNTTTSTNNNVVNSVL